MHYFIACLLSLLSLLSLRNNYIPCWDAECKSLYKTFLQSPQGDDSSLTTLLAKLDRKRRDRWSEAVRSIDFSHSVEKRGVF